MPDLEVTICFVRIKEESEKRRDISRYRKQGYLSFFLHYSFWYAIYLDVCKELLRRAYFNPDVPHSDSKEKGEKRQAYLPTTVTTYLVVCIEDSIYTDGENDGSISIFIDRGIPHR